MKMMATTMHISPYVLKKIKMIGATKSDLSRALGISRQNLHYKITKDAWRVSDIQKIADFLGVKIYDIFIEVMMTGGNDGG